MPPRVPMIPPTMRASDMIDRAMTNPARNPLGPMTTAAGMGAVRGPAAPAPFLGAGRGVLERAPLLSGMRRPLSRPMPSPGGMTARPIPPGSMGGVTRQAVVPAGQTFARPAAAGMGRTLGGRPPVGPMMARHAGGGPPPAVTGGAVPPFRRVAPSPQVPVAAGRRPARPTAVSPGPGIASYAPTPRKSRRMGEAYTARSDR